jgi:hypothetical protein
MAIITLKDVSCNIKYIFLVGIALLYQLLDFCPTFTCNFNCLPINLNGKGNWLSIWHICKTWQKLNKSYQIFTLSNRYVITSRKWPFYNWSMRLSFSCERHLQLKS